MKRVIELFFVLLFLASSTACRWAVVEDRTACFEEEEEEEEEPPVVEPDEIKHELEITADGPYTKKVGEVIRLSAFYITLTNGVVSDRQDVTLNTRTSWTSNADGIYVIRGEEYAEVTSNKEGFGVIQCKYADAIALVTVSFKSVFTHELEVNTDNPKGDYKTPVRFNAVYWTLVDGVRKESIDVTEEASWSVSQPLPYPVYSVTGGVVTADASLGSHSVAGSPIVVVSYRGLDAAETAYFTDVDDSFINILLEDNTSADGLWIAAGSEPVNLYAWYTRVLNGFEIVPESGLMLTDEWRSSDKNVLTVKASGSGDAGVVTAKNAGSATVSATYSGQTGSVKINVFKWDDSWDDGPEDEV